MDKRPATVTRGNCLTAITGIPYGRHNDYGLVFEPVNRCARPLSTRGHRFPRATFRRECPNVTTPSFGGNIVFFGCPAPRSTCCNFSAGYRGEDAGRPCANRCSARKRNRLTCITAYPTWPSGNTFPPDSTSSGRHGGRCYSGGLLRVPPRQTRPLRSVAQLLLFE